MGPKNACIYADVAMNSIDVMGNEGEWNLEQKPLLNLHLVHFQRQNKGKTYPW